VREASSVLDAPPPPASPDEVSVLAALAAEEPRHIEDVIVRCGLAPARVGATLGLLELAGSARQLEGQRWIAVGARARRA
jgi:predicted Rossmann fold nucleotide-binding protein DprA/Smf involved in DNA uptake